MMRKYADFLDFLVTFSLIRDNDYLEVAQVLDILYIYSIHSQLC